MQLCWPAHAATSNAGLRFLTKNMNCEVVMSRHLSSAHLSDPWAENCLYPRFVYKAQNKCLLSSLFNEVLVKLCVFYFILFQKRKKLFGKKKQYKKNSTAQMGYKRRQYVSLVLAEEQSLNVCFRVCKCVAWRINANKQQTDASTQIHKVKEHDLSWHKEGMVDMAYREVK